MVDTQGQVIHPFISADVQSYNKVRLNSLQKGAIPIGTAEWLTHIYIAICPKRNFS